MDDSVQPLFPVPSCVVFGRRRATSRPLPDKVRAYSGTLPFRDAPEKIADARLKVREDAPALEIATFEGGSAYRTMFRQGATLVPRMLCFIERKEMGRLGADPSVPYVASRRTNQEKKPWKSLAGIENRVEAEFLRPVLLGESILPYRIFRPFEAVVSVTNKGEVLDADAAANRGFEGLHGWMTKAEKVWNANQTSEMSLIQQFDYYGKLSSQFPLAPLRVVYCRSGTHQASATIHDPSLAIDFSLYWSAFRTIDECRFLTALFNSEASRQRFEGYQSRGQWGTRDFAKVMFNLPIPCFDVSNGLHMQIAEAAGEAESIAAGVALPESIKFQRARGLIRKALADAGIAQKIDALVARLLDGD